MSLFKIFDVAGSGMTAQSTRLNTVASNLANADSVAGTPEDVYRPRMPVFAQALDEAGRADAPRGVQVLGVLESQAEPVRRHQPGHPLADEQGYVYAAPVNEVEQMVDMISASRSFQNNAEVLSTSKEMLLSTLNLAE